MTRAMALAEVGNQTTSSLRISIYNNREGRVEVFSGVEKAKSQAILELISCRKCQKASNQARSLMAQQVEEVGVGMLGLTLTRKRLVEG